MNSLVLATLATTSLAFGGMAAAATIDNGAASAPTLTLSAAGEVKATPDMASLSLGVQTTKATAGQAMAANAARMNQVIGALKSAGIAPRDLQTSSIGLTPQMVYEQDKPPRLTGYQASNQLTVTVRDLSRLGGVVDAVAAAGATDIGQISFGLADPAPAESAARLAAVKALNDKAALYARATGYRISRLQSLTEGEPETNGPRPMPMMAMRVAAAPTPVETGEQTVHIDITGVFELMR